MQTQTSRQPVEDINAVLGRFQAWTGTRTKAASKDGIREISYEEALRSSRYRRPAASGRPLSPLASEPLAQAAAEVPASPSAESKLQSAKPKRAVESIGAKTPAKRKSKTQLMPQFREVLEKHIEPSAHIARTAKTTSLEPRQVSLSVRLSASDQATIKLRAAEAGISASAYMRQCALDVEQLRAQVKETIALMQRTATTAPAPVVVRVPGIVAWLRRRLFGPGTTGLSLRA
jgi:predicted DNA binding CopG/RHH family protein